MQGQVSWNIIHCQWERYNALKVLFDFFLVKLCFTITKVVLLPPVDLHRWLTLLVNFYFYLLHHPFIRGRRRRKREKIVKIHQPTPPNQTEVKGWRRIMLNDDYRVKNKEWLRRRGFLGQWNPQHICPGLAFILKNLSQVLFRVLIIIACKFYVSERIF